MGDIRVRISNGYRLLYKPEHPSSIKTSGNWFGYVYEHVVVAETNLGRRMTSTEVVHHLDLDRQNNNYANLLVLERSQHGKLHQWLDRGAPMTKVVGENRLNSGNAKSREESKYCIICGLTLRDKQINVCSRECERIRLDKPLGKRSKPIPSKEELLELLVSNTREGVGRLYNVSGNAVKKWMKRYELDTRILSQVKGKPLNGAETTGDVNHLNDQLK